MTTAPIVPTACVSMYDFINGSARPSASAAPSVSASPQFTKKHAAIVAMSVATSASSLRTPRWCTARNVNVSRPVTRHPTQSSKPHKMFSPMALPNTSWMSLPMIASSIIA